MFHVALLGDSVFDNASYTNGQPDVISQVRENLPSGWRATLCAVDGSTTEEIPEQLESVPRGTTHLALSVGGNNAIQHADILARPVKSSGEALLLLADVAHEFECQFRKAVSACLRQNLPLAVCTIYHGNFEDRAFQRAAVVALTLFNDAIVRTAVEHRLTVVDLRAVCREPADFANPIEPSSIGGAKIARAIVRAVTDPTPGGRTVRVVASES
jgi:GDSL-like lipase/acylhydrolase family protein